jgi:hypothetical protein
MAEPGSDSSFIERVYLCGLVVGQRHALPEPPAGHGPAPREDHHMPTLEWRDPIVFCSDGDEKAFFEWLGSIGGVMRVEGQGRSLVIHLRSNKVSKLAARELAAIYRRYGGNLKDLEVLN